MLHRWQYPDGHRRTRMLTANTDGEDLRIVDDNGLTSHFIWRDPSTILAFSEQQPHGRGFFLFQDKTGGEVEFRWERYPQTGRALLVFTGRRVDSQRHLSRL